MKQLRDRALHARPEFDQVTDRTRELLAAVTVPIVAEHVPRVLTGESDAVGFSVAGVVKDGVMFRRTARQYGVSVPAIEAAFASYSAHLEKGNGEKDLATMVRAAYEEA